MPPRAHVTSVEAIKDFRANLVIYLSKARPALEEVSGEVLRTRLWLENEQRVLLEGQVRKRTRDFEETPQALFSAQISQLRDESSAEQANAHRAKRALEEATQKLRTLKHWDRDFEARVQPLVKQMEKLETILSGDMPKALASLEETIRALEGYLSVTAETSGTPAPSSGNSAVEGTPGASGSSSGPT